MKIRRALLAGFIALISSLCFAQEATRDTTGDAAFEDAVLQLTYILQGAPLEKVETYIPEREGMVITNDSTIRLRDLLKSNNRQALFHEDSTRQGVEISARSDKTYNAAYVMLKTVDARKEHPHYHTFTLFKEPDHGWQVFLWHVGG
jgi:hypothetical protein